MVFCFASQNKNSFASKHTKPQELDFNPPKNFKDNKQYVKQQYCSGREGQIQQSLLIVPESFHIIENPPVFGFFTREQRTFLVLNVEPALCNDDSEQRLDINIGTMGFLRAKQDNHIPTHSQCMSITIVSLLLYVLSDEMKQLWSLELTKSVLIMNEDEEII